MNIQKNIDILAKPVWLGFRTVYTHQGTTKMNIKQTWEKRGEIKCVVPVSFHTVSIRFVLNKETGRDSFNTFQGW
jgi:hypothetical protein